MTAREFRLELSREYGDSYMYVSEGQEGHREVNGLYIRKDILDDSPPEGILITIHWDRED